ncbi:WD40 repeat-like protein [Aureobasidium pullulans]|uniref:WD40 repeat-like protein n=1 Tax=Aureobasidium pullulans TaxID=5580 RepID=A0A4S9VF05_AURPU|nr:WD40 repeat-like protein [Aureobasidium pullulans]THZ50413.1 WD40 repeat-like protein [Aureobasidium pullulans]
MKAAPLLVSWHNDNNPIYSAHFEPHGKGRLATAGGDNNVRLWKIDGSGEDRSVTYLSTLAKHTQAVNVVRWCPRGELLASAGDDGNILLWVPGGDSHLHATAFGEDGLEDKETWRVKAMCRSTGSEIYDLAWSPDGVFFITGSMDNVARIYNAQTGSVIRQVAEHHHYVQGVAWDPMNEYIATQSSDRSVHIYTLKTKDGQCILTNHNKISKMDMPTRRISQSSPAPPDFRGRASFVGNESPAPSAPGTPLSLALPMNPPPQTTHSRRSSFGSVSVSGQSMRRSVSPSPSMPLPAVMPSPSPSIGGGLNMPTRSTPMYANETFTSFFRRLTFAPDGSLLFTPAGQHKEVHSSTAEPNKIDDVVNMTYIYTRAGLNKPPVAKLPGHKKPSLAVKCSPIFYTLRASPVPTKDITIDTQIPEEISFLPEPVLPAKATSSMEPPPIVPSPAPSHAHSAAIPSPRSTEDGSAAPTPLPGPHSVFDLPYRIVYAVATQDSVHVYDTQQAKPLCVVSNLHYATFTDLTWSNDGNTLLMTSSDGFCSSLNFQPGELGVPCPQPPVAASLPTPLKRSSSSQGPSSAPSPSPFAMPGSPVRGATDTPEMSSVPSLTAAAEYPFKRRRIAPTRVDDPEL